MVWLTSLFGLAGWQRHGQVSGQRRVIGDIREQKVSQVADIDAREENVYRRPPTYLILASKIVRPSTIYQVHLPVCLFVCLFVFVCLSVCLFVCLSVCLFVRLSVCLYIYLSINQSIYKSIYLSR